MPSPQSPLKAELDRRGIRHAWLARQLGASKWTFWRIEEGVQPAPADWYERAARVLGVRVEDIAPQREVAA